MKKMLLFFVVLVVGINSNPGLAAEVCSLCTTDDPFLKYETSIYGVNPTYYCKSDRTTHVTTSYASCVSGSGYVLTKETNKCSNVTTYTCAKECTGCTNCISTVWSNYQTGYQSRTTATCNCNTCSKFTTYRCAAGYYQSSPNGLPTCLTTGKCTGCSPCETTDMGTPKSPAGSTVSTACYIPSGTTGTDDVGTWKLTANCYDTD